MLLLMPYSGLRARASTRDVLIVCRRGTTVVDVGLLLEQEQGPCI